MFVVETETVQQRSDSKHGVAEKVSDIQHVFINEKIRIQGNKYYLGRSTTKPTKLHMRQRTLRSACADERLDAPCVAKSSSRLQRRLTRLQGRAS